MITPPQLPAQKTPAKKIGGLPYFLGQLCVPVVALFQCYVLCAYLFSNVRMDLLLCIGLAVVIGYRATPYLIFGPFAVFLHELKHAVVSSLAGNRAKGMRIFSRSGRFEYEYTSKSAHMNAYISLAPYCFPLFGLFAFLVSAFLFEKFIYLRAFLVSLAFASDLRLARQDIGPHQSDFTNLLGGYRLGLVYVCFANLFFATTLLLWAYAGWRGMRSLADAYLGIWLWLSVGATI
jgi:hypothetical protein